MRGSTPYFSSLGIKQHPFEPFLTEETFFNYPQFEQRVRVLEKMVNNSDMILVTADFGAGKTTLLARFLTRAHKDWRQCQIKGESFLDPPRLLPKMMEGLGLRPPIAGQDVLWEALRDYLEELQTLARRPILIIDDAHLLPPESLELILTLTGTSGTQRKLLCAILFAEPMIKKHLSEMDPDLLSVPSSHALYLPALTLDQTEEYLDHRLRTAGLNSHSPLTSEDIKIIYQQSQGLPGKINKIAHQMLLQRGEESLWQRFFRAFRQLASSPLRFLKNREWKPPYTHHHKKRPMLSSKIENKTAGLVTGLKNIWQNQKAVRLMVLAVIPLLIAVMVIHFAISSSDPSTQDNAPQVSDNTTRSDEYVTSKLALPKAAPPPNTVESTSLPTAPSSETATTIPPPEKGTVNSEGDIIPPGSMTGTQPPSKEEGMAESMVNTPPSSQPETAEQGDHTAVKVQGNSWLKNQDPNAYTIQLIALSDREQAVKFIADNKLQGKAALIKGGANRANWLVLYGVYTRNHEAQAAIRNLPAPIRKNQPWSRNIKTLIKESH